VDPYDDDRARQLIAIAASLPRVLLLAGWLVLGVVALAVLALLRWTLCDDDRADRLARILHGPTGRRR
jgi:hypothetical protein